MIAFYKTETITEFDYLWYRHITKKRLATSKRRIKNLFKIAKTWQEKGYKTKVEINKQNATLEVYDGE